MAGYWLVWSKFEDNNSRVGLPGGFRTLKEARECAYANVVTNHPIEIEGSRSGEVIKKVKGIVYSEKTTRSGTTRQYVLQDGSLSKVNVAPKSVSKTTKSASKSKTAPKSKSKVAPKSESKVAPEQKKKRKGLKGLGGEVVGAALDFGIGFFSH